MSVFHIPIMCTCLIGLMLSTYAYHVERRADEAKRLGLTYRALCDIGPFSCTRVFSSEFGYATAFFGLPPVSNALVGMAFYFVEALCSWSPTIVLILSAQSVFASVVLAYILIFVLHDLCVVCCSVYVVNICTALMAYSWWKRRCGRRAYRKRD